MAMVAVLVNSFPCPSSACLWRNELTVDGTRKQVGISKALFEWRRAPRTAKETREEARAVKDNWRNAHDLPSRNEYGWALTYLGEYTNALQVLHAIEQEQPGLYPTAANLGTAYELAGNNQEALKWITTALIRNPDAHEGTEWLHREILKAKIRLEKDSKALLKEPVLSLPPTFGRSKEALLVFGSERYNASDVEKAIRYQLKERLQFVTPPDPVVAQLMRNYSEIEVATGTLQTATSYLDFALSFGLSNEDYGVFSRRYNRLLMLARIRHYWPLGFIVALLGAVGFSIYRRTHVPPSSRPARA